MKARPITLHELDVRAFMSGLRTQMRLALRSPTPDARPEIDGDEWVWRDEQGTMSSPLKLPCQVGDRLWVREGWAAGACASGLRPGELAPRFWKVDNGGLWYRAGGDPVHPVTPRGRWRSPASMPRWASRMTLVVKDVRVRRLQDISEAEACDEGVKWLCEECKPPVAETHRDAFRSFWNTIHSPAAWDENPWVAALSVRAHDVNVDMLPLKVLHG